MGGDGDDAMGGLGGFGGLFGGLGGARAPRGHGQRQPAPPKPSALHMKVPCTLEELFHGFTKKLKVTRKVQDASGVARQESSVLEIAGKPGWKSGTKLTFPEVR